MSEVLEWGDGEANGVSVESPHDIGDDSWYSDEEFEEWSRIVLEDESEEEGKLSDQEGREPVLREYNFERGDREVRDEGGCGEGDKYSEEDGL